MSNPDDQQQPSPHRLAGWYGKLLLGRRRTFAILIGVLTLAAAAGLLQLKFDSEPRKIFERSDADFRILEEYFEHFGADDNDVLLILHSEFLYSPECSRALRDFVRAAAAARGVEAVVSILDVPGPAGQSLYPLPTASQREFGAARKAATTHPFIAGQLVSENGKSMVVRIVLEKDDPQTIAKLRPIYQTLRDLRDSSFGELPVEAYFAGSVAVRVETLAGVRGEFYQITALGALIAVVIALLLFRSPATTLIVASGPATAVLWTLGMMGWLGLDIEGISTPIPSIVFVVSFANAVHLMLDMRRSRSTGCDPVESAHLAVRHLGLACVLTSVTTTIGFGSLMLAETASVQRFGLSTALGSLLGLLSNLTVLPLLASLSKRPARRLAPASDASSRPTGPLAALGSLIIKGALPITVFALLATAVLLWCASQLKSDIIWTETLPADSESKLAMDRADKDFGGAMQAFVVVAWDDSVEFGGPEMIVVLRQIDNLIAADPTFRGSLSLLSFLPAVPEQAITPELLALVAERAPPTLLHRLLRTDLRRLVVSTHLPNKGAAATRPAFARMKHDLVSLQALHPGFSFHLTGSAVVAAENMTSVIGDLVRSLSFASVTVFLVLTVALRSLTLGLISIIPNAFPLLLNAGILYALEKPLQITSVLTFSICLGIAVDDTIHFLIRFLRERREGRSVRDATVSAFQHVGLALLITTAIIAGGFLAAMTSSMPGLVFFGGLACTALLAALIGDLVILPAMLERYVGRKERAARRRAESR